MANPFEKPQAAQPSREHPEKQRPAPEMSAAEQKALEVEEGRTKKKAREAPAKRENVRITDLMAEETRIFDALNKISKAVLAQRLEVLPKRLDGSKRNFKHASEKVERFDEEYSEKNWLKRLFSKRPSKVRPRAYADAVKSQEGWRGEIEQDKKEIEETKERLQKAEKGEFREEYCRLLRKLHEVEDQKEDYFERQGLRLKEDTETQRRNRVLEWGGLYGPLLEEIKKIEAEEKE